MVTSGRGPNSFMSCDRLPNQARTRKHIPSTTLRHVLEVDVDELAVFVVPEELDNVLVPQALHKLQLVLELLQVVLVRQ